MDSFFFEAKAFEEVLRRFLVNTLQYILNDKHSVAGQKYEEMASQSGAVNDEPWSPFLYRVRMKFIHNAAPWIAVDLSRSEEGAFDFLIMSENIKEFPVARPDSFLPAIRDMNQLWTCLQTVSQHIEDYLIDRISKL